MRLQTDQEFNQKEIKILNEKFNVEHFNSRLNEGHAMGAEQKIRELKERLKNFKRIKKKKKSASKSNEALKKVMINMNIQPATKYGVAPD